MAPGLTLRVAWICLLLSCAAAFPATKGDYKYPYTATWSNSGSSGSSNSPSGGSRPPSMLLSQPQALAHQPSSTSSFSAPSVPAPKAPAEGTGYVSPPTSPEKKAPSFPVHPQPASGTAGDWGATSRFAPSHNNAPALRMGDGPMPYSGGSSAGYPALRMGDGPMPYSGGSSAGYPALRMGDGPMPYSGGSSAGYPALKMGDGPMPYSGGSSAGYLALRVGDGPMPYSGGSSAGYPALRVGDGPMPYSGGSSAGYPALRMGDGPMPYGGPKPDAPLRPAQPAGEAYVSAPVFLPLPPHPFPEFRWEAAPETLSETSPLPPSSYIIQTRNGFQRARDFHSHMQYSPEYLPPPINPPNENNAPSELPPSGPKGGVLYRG